MRTSASGYEVDTDLEIHFNRRAIGPPLRASFYSHTRDNVELLLAQCRRMRDRIRGGERRAAREGLATVARRARHAR